MQPKLQKYRLPVPHFIQVHLVLKYINSLIAKLVNIWHTAYDRL